MSCLVRAGDREIREYLRNGQISRVCSGNGPLSLNVAEGLERAFSGNVCAEGLEPKDARVFATKV